MLSQLGIHNLKQKISELSGGQRKRVALAGMLIDEPDFIMLDEPTNHLDVEAINWLESYLQRSRSTLFMVTHDRYFLDRVCNEIIELDGKQIYTYPGNYSYFLEKGLSALKCSSLKSAKLRIFCVKKKTGCVVCQRHVARKPSIGLIITTT